MIQKQEKKQYKWIEYKYKTSGIPNKNRDHIKT